MKSVTEIIDALNAACLGHYLFNEFIDNTRCALNAANGSEVVWLTGPSRVGKTKGTEEVRLELEKRNPLVGTRVTMRIAARNASTSGGFSTKSFTQQMLAAIDHPFYGKPTPDDPSGIKLANRIHRASEAELQLALQLALVDLEIKYLFIDEAQHLMHIPGGLGKVSAVLDSLKGLAEEAGITLLFSGAYPLLPLLSSNPHLAGRSELVHFPRYQLEREGDLDHFAALVQAVDANIGKKVFIPHLRLVFEESLGCAGLLLRLVRTTLARAERQPGGLVTRELIQQCSRQQAERHSILTEIVEGERLLNYGELPTDKKPSRSNGKGNLKPFQTKTKSHPKQGRL